MTEYKDSLNLPHTAFPMKASLPQREPQMLAEWQAQGVYEKIRKARAGRARFILHDGPPYANGHLHCGHALNKILKDIVNKSKTLSGFDAPFVPGWDCHGLPVELNVEKKVGKAGVKVSPTAFREHCRDYASSQIDIQRDEFQRLGVLGDWQNPYTTMNYTYEANSLRALSQLIANGHLHQGFKPVHWCVDCASSLAEAEVDYEDKTSASIDAAFYAIDFQNVLKKTQLNLQEKPVIVPIWTTTPWTLPANEAVCLNPELDYAVLDAGSNYYVVAKALASSAMTRYGISEFQVVGVVKGLALEGLALKHPFYERVVPIVLGAHVTIESGTGCVHTAPAHGPDDYQVGLAYHLPLINPVLANGCFAEDVLFFAGLPVLKSNGRVMDVLRENNTLLHDELLQHSYPHCWRHKTPLIFRATPQWFVSMEKNKLRAQLLLQIERVNWVPDWGKARITKMVETRPDWCVSRQRSWSTPMPLFLHKETGELHPNTEALIEQVAVRVEARGIEAWFDLDASELLGDDAPLYEKSKDTMDVWFDSGVSHRCVLKENKQLAFPADLYFEGSDQHRGWFNSSLTTSVAMYGVAPYKTVLTHGFTVDAQGKKLSKSMGNYVALDKLIGQHGADILRLWVASTDFRNEVSISDEIIKRNGDAYRRIRNTARFLLSNLFDFVPTIHSVATQDLVELDKWAIKRAENLQKELLAAYDDYHFHVIYQKIHNFCAIDLGSFYLDIIKDRQYTSAENSIARRSCQTAMYHIAQALTRWLAPILSFTAEEIWQQLPDYQGESVFIEEWYQAWPQFDLPEMADWTHLQAIRDEVNKALETARQAGIIGSSLAAKVIVYANPTTQRVLARLKNELRFIFITSCASVCSLDDRPKDGVLNDTLGVAIHVEASEALKCARCWHRCDDIGEHTDHPALCLRCVGNITGDDEIRHFA